MMVRTAKGGMKRVVENKGVRSICDVIGRFLYTASLGSSHHSAETASDRRSRRPLDRQSPELPTPHHFR